MSDDRLREEIVVDNGAATLGLKRVDHPARDDALAFATEQDIGGVTPGGEVHITFETIYGDEGRIVIKVPDPADQDARESADLGGDRSD